MVRPWRAVLFVKFYCGSCARVGVLLDLEAVEPAAEPLPAAGAAAAGDE